MRLKSHDTILHYQTHNSFFCVRFVVQSRINFVITTNVSPALCLSLSEVASVDRTAVLLQRGRVCAAVAMPPVTAYGRIHDVIKAIEERGIFTTTSLMGKTKTNSSLGHRAFVGLGSRLF